MRRCGLALLLVGALACSGEGEHGTPAAREAAPAVRPRPRPLAPELRGAARVLEEQRYEAGRELVLAHLAKHPDDGQAMYLLGMSHYWTGNYGAARPWLERALEREPEIYIAHESLGYSLFLLGELAGARREYEAYMQYAPDDPKGHYGLGLIDLDESRLDSAAGAFRRAIELFDALGREDPRQLAARQPELAECHARLGEVHFARDELEAARAELLRATSLCPGNISAFYTLSLVYRRLGDAARADEAAGRYESARQAILARQKGGAGR